MVLKSSSVSRFADPSATTAAAAQTFGFRRFPYSPPVLPRTRFGSLHVLRVERPALRSLVRPESQPAPSPSPVGRAGLPYTPPPSDAVQCSVAGRLPHIGVFDNSGTERFEHGRVDNTGICGGAGFDNAGVDNAGHSLKPPAGAEAGRGEDGGGGKLRFLALSCASHSERARTQEPD